MNIIDLHRFHQPVKLPFQFSHECTDNSQILSRGCFLHLEHHSTQPFSADIGGCTLDGMGLKLNAINIA